MRDQKPRGRPAVGRSLPGRGGPTAGRDVAAAAGTRTFFFTGILLKLPTQRKNAAAAATVSMHTPLSSAMAVQETTSRPAGGESVEERPRGGELDAREVELDEPIADGEAVVEAELGRKPIVLPSSHRKSVHSSMNIHLRNVGSV
uniref:Uncharacterized protein n=1 Tax=Oryza nivara TaxID=4536 RepID=A0A0E0HTV7_ORYNI